MRKDFRSGTAIGWRAVRDGNQVTGYDLVQIVLTQPSVLQTVSLSKTFYLGDITADSDALVCPLWKLPAGTKIKIAAAKVAVDTDAAAVDTNYNTLTLQEGSDVIASLAKGPATGGVALTAGVFADMTLVNTLLEWDAGDELVFKFTKTGNGQALSGLQVQIDYYDYND